MKILAPIGSFSLALALATQTATASSTLAPTAKIFAVQPGSSITRPALSRAPSVPETGFLKPVSKSVGLVYVSDYGSSEISVFQADRSFGRVGTITNGIRNPEQMAVDRFGTLYVCNIGANTVTEYPRGASSPTKTLHIGLAGPSGIAVSRNGTIYVSNNNFPTSTIVAFTPSSDSPTIITQAIQFPLGLALDKDGNLFVGAEEAGVYEIPNGTSIPKQLKINVAQFIIGVTVRPSGELDVSGQANNNLSSQVDEFNPPYLGSPQRTISTGSNAAPYYLSSPGNFLLVPLQGLNRVNVYYGESTTSVAAITRGLNEPTSAVYAPGT